MRTLGHARLLYPVFSQNMSHQQLSMKKEDSIRALITELAKHNQDIGDSHLSIFVDVTLTQ